MNLLMKTETCPTKKGMRSELYVASYDGNEIRLSKSVSGAGTLNMLRDAHENSIPMEGKVKGQVKGGYQVEIAERRAFCPISQIDLRPADSRISTWENPTPS